MGSCRAQGSKSSFELSHGDGGGGDDDDAGGGCGDDDDDDAGDDDDLNHLWKGRGRQGSQLQQQQLQQHSELLAAERFFPKKDYLIFISAQMYDNLSRWAWSLLMWER